MSCARVGEFHWGEVEEVFAEARERAGCVATRRSQHDCWTGRPFEDAMADRALFRAVKDGLVRSDNECQEVARDINDKGFAIDIAGRLVSLDECESFVADIAQIPVV